MVTVWGQKKLGCIGDSIDGLELVVLQDIIPIIDVWGGEMMFDEVHGEGGWDGYCHVLCMSRHSQEPGI
jgi:hypothetical protein